MTAFCRWWRRRPGVKNGKGGVPAPVSVELSHDDTHLRYEAVGGRFIAAAPLLALPEKRLIAEAVRELTVIRNRTNAQVDELKEIAQQIEHEIGRGTKARDALDEAIFLLADPKDLHAS